MALTAASCAWSAAHAAPAKAAEPWSDPTPGAPAQRHAIGDFGVTGAVEYRATGQSVNPILLSSETNQRVAYIDQRLRLGGSLDWQKTVRVSLLLDALDGVLFGDNGTYGDDPSPNSGTHVNTKNPNLARVCVQYKGGDPLSASGYGYGLCPADPITVRQAFGEVALPFGLLRVGRQPINIGAGLQANDGEGRPNRFGVSHNGNTVDRILFATKPFEAFKPEKQRDRSETRGFILALAYDTLLQDDPQRFSDDTRQIALAGRLLEPKWSLGTDALLAAFYVYRWDNQYATAVHAAGLRGYSTFGKLALGVDLALNRGSTQEIAAGYKFITNDPVVDQPIASYAGRAVIRWDERRWGAYLEIDYASGNDDPRARQPLTQFVWAEDTHVGLLLFPQVLGFYSARASAAGVETLRRLGAPTNPAEAVDTRGAFTNAIAIFPQLDVKPADDWLIRAGMLVAWGQSRVIDPIASLQNKRGPDIEPALVNYAGGKPDRFYGVELDGRIRWRFREHFDADLEGAVLFPGPALYDQDGRAVRAVMIAGRTTFYF